MSTETSGAKWRQEQTEDGRSFSVIGGAHPRIGSEGASWGPEEIPAAEWVAQAEDDTERAKRLDLLVLAWHQPELAGYRERIDDALREQGRLPPERTHGENRDLALRLLGLRYADMLDRLSTAEQLDQMADAGMWDVFCAMRQATYTYGGPHCATTLAVVDGLSSEAEWSAWAQQHKSGDDLPWPVAEDGEPALGAQGTEEIDRLAADLRRIQREQEADGIRVDFEVDHSPAPPRPTTTHSRAETLRGIPAAVLRQVGVEPKGLFPGIDGPDGGDLRDHARTVLGWGLLLRWCHEDRLLDWLRRECLRVGAERPCQWSEMAHPPSWADLMAPNGRGVMPVPGALAVDLHAHGEAHPRTMRVPVDVLRQPGELAGEEARARWVSAGLVPGDRVRVVVARVARAKLEQMGDAPPRPEISLTLRYEASALMVAQMASDAVFRAVYGRPEPEDMDELRGMQPRPGFERHQIGGGAVQFLELYHAPAADVPAAVIPYLVIQRVTLRLHRGELALEVSGRCAWERTAWCELGLAHAPLWATMSPAQAALFPPDTDAGRAQAKRLQGKLF